LGEYKHLSDKKTFFSFSSKDKVLKVNAKMYDPVVSESLFSKFATKQEEEIRVKLLDEGEDDDFYMDFIVAIGAKKQNYDGVIYDTGKGNLIGLDLRNHSVKEIPSLKMFHGRTPKCCSIVKCFLLSQLNLS